MSLLRQLYPYLWPKDESNFRGRLRLVSAFGLLLTGKLLNIQVPYIFKLAVDKLDESQRLGNLVGDVNILSMTGTILLGYIAARIGASATSEFKNVIFSRISQAAQRNIAAKTFRHLHALDHSFHNQTNTGVVSRTIDRGVKGINFMSTAILFNILPTMIEIGLVCGVLTWQFGPTYALLAGGTMLSYAAFTLKVTAWRTTFRKMMNTAENDAAGNAFDSLQHHETVKLFTNEDRETRKYVKSLHDYEVAARRTAWSLALLNIGQQAIFSMALGGIMYLSAMEIISGTATIGDMVLVNGLVFQLSLPLNFLGTIYRELRQSMVDIEALFKLLQTKPKIIDNTEKPLVVSKGKILVDNVSLMIDGRQIIKNISLNIPAGMKVALVGPSGSGKSTLIKLLLRYIEPDAGRILIDGQPIDSVTLNSLRQAIGMVPQDASLFNRTIKENVAYAKPTAMETEILQACQKAKLDDLVGRLPQGWDTKVGERGVILSGGEKQRVALARLMLRNPPIMVFDEATSALDAKSESMVLDSVRGINEEKTCIFIAHRLSTIRDVDMIVVLKDGEIVEEGTHESLLARRSLYRDLWNAYLKERKDQE